jgi:hypothetical protein
VGVEARAGSLERLAGTPPTRTPTGQLDMARWKTVVADAAAGQPQPELEVIFGGGVNQITGYRLYYMLQYAKRHGIAQLCLHTDGLCWTGEADAWLAESGVDAIRVYVAAEHRDPFADRTRALQAAAARAGVAAPRVEFADPGTVPTLSLIDWVGDTVRS